MSQPPVFVVGSADILAALDGIARAAGISLAHEGTLAGRRVTEVLRGSGLIFAEDTETCADLIDRSDDGRALMYVVTTHYSLARAQDLLLGRRRVIGYVDHGRLQNEQVRAEIERLMQEASQAQTDAPGPDDRPLGWAIGPVSSEDYRARRLVSLFIGGMREFVVDLKLLLADLRDRRERAPLERPGQHVDVVRQLDHWHRWVILDEKPQTKEDKEARKTFDRDRAEYRLFSPPPIDPRPPIILIRGESGTGKSLVAQLVHAEARPAEFGAFQDILCTGIPDLLLESELFGALAGSYTDRKETAPGRILGAYGGVLFLDEIGEMPMHLQGKLLKFLDDSRVYPLGWSGEGILVPLIVVAATNADLENLVSEKRFRADLLYRLQQHELRIPPLRERMWDIDRMVDFILQNPTHNRGPDGAPYVTHVEQKLLDALRRHEFGGHFRELEGILFKAVRHARLRGIRVLRADHIPSTFWGGNSQEDVSVARSDTNLREPRG